MRGDEADVRWWKTGAPTWGATVLLLASQAGCATAVPDPPAPLAPVEPPAREARADLVPVEALLPPIATPAPPRPWAFPAAYFSAERPREGSAIGLWLVAPPAGRPPLAVEAELAGRPLPLVRTADGWFGVGALPVGSAGVHLLVARFRVSADSTVELHEPVWVAGRRYASTELRVASRYADPPAAVLARIREERARIDRALADVTSEWLAADGFDWPRSDRTTSPFGQRRVFNGQLRSRHWGLDIDGDVGAPVRAAADGRVALSGELFYQGNAVYLDHGLGVYTGYFHLSRLEVGDGERVTRGQVIGRVGSTGRVTGPHLHWSLYVGGASLDPASLLEIRDPIATGGTRAPATSEIEGPSR